MQTTVPGFQAHLLRGRYRDEGAEHFAIASAGLSSAQLLRPFVGREPVAGRDRPGSFRRLVMRWAVGISAPRQSIRIS
jgi:hypothetical protein